VTLDPDDLVGRVVGPYHLERLIGQGGFAWVYEARHTGSNTVVALKLLKPRYAGDAQFEAQFRKEAQLASELHHPNIVEIVDIGHVGEFSYFAMPLYPDSLDSVLQRDGPLAEPRLLEIARDLAAGLAYAHEQGLVHRDIKPHNALITADGAAVISDFGIARAVSGYASATGVAMTIGTPQYISPEQAQGLPLDGRSDLYALGVTLYRAATGDAPFRSTDWFELARMHVEAQPPAPRKRRPELSARFERVILRCLAKHPDDRYPSATALLGELDALADRARDTRSFGVAPPGAEPSMAGTGAGRRGRWLLPLVAVAIVILVALAVVVLGR
jgi:serine/threonine protein kinase